MLRLYESYVNVYEKNESCDEYEDVEKGEKEEKGENEEKKSEPKAKKDKDEKEMKESNDLYDLVLEYLLDEGLCESVENAEIMMAHMSEGWVESIVDEAATIMAVKSPKGEDRKVSKLRSGQETSQQIQKRAFSQQLSDNQKERQKRMNAGRATVARKRGMEMANWKNQTKYYDRDEYDEADAELNHNAAHEAHLSNVRSKARARKGR